MDAERFLNLGWPIKETSGALPYEIEREYMTSDLDTSVKHNRDAHIITFAPTGAGKGVSCVIPTLLDYDGSAIVIDPKGENFSVTAKYRSEQLRQKIYVIDPYEVVTPVQIAGQKYTSSALNPMDLMSISSDSKDSVARVLATALIPNLSSIDPFWDIAAINLLSSLISYVGESSKYSDIDRNFVSVAQILSDDIELAISDILDQEIDQLSRFTRTALQNFLNISSADKARDSIILVSNTYVQNFLTREISSCVSTTTFNLRSLISGDEKYTLYLVIPPEKMEADANVLRLWISTLLKAIVTRRRNLKKKDLFLLDECAQLGRLDELRQVVTLLRGYGVIAWMFFQDLSQLSSVYPDWKSIVNNCGTIQCFGYDRKMPAQELCDILGNISVEEMLDVSSSNQVLSIFGRKTLTARKLNYLTDRVFRERAVSNPYFT